MTKEEIKIAKDILSELPKLNNEIRTKKIRLHNLRASSTSISPNFSGVHSSGGVSDKTGSIADALDLEKEIAAGLAKAKRQFAAIYAFTNTIESSEVRQIIEYRYGDNLPWLQVARSIGIKGDDPAQNARHTLDRWLEKHGNLNVLNHYFGL